MNYTHLICAINSHQFDVVVDSPALIDIQLDGVAAAAHDDDDDRGDKGDGQEGEGESDPKWTGRVRRVAKQKINPINQCRRKAERGMWGCAVQFTH